MTTPPDNSLLRMDGWPGGVNNRIRETEQAVMRDGEAIPSSQFLRRALNVDLTAEGHPLRRKGRTVVESGYSHSLWYSRTLGRFFAVVEGVLKSGPKITELTEVRTINRYLPVSYTDFQGSVYFMNGRDSGRFGPTGTFLGYEVWPPLTLPLGIGEYPRQGMLTKYAGVDPITNRPIPEYEFQNLNPDDLTPPPVGQLIAAHSGRLYIAVDNVLWFTDPMTADYHQAARNFFEFTDYIWMLQPVETGIYIGTKHGVFYLSGRDPFDMRRNNVYPRGVIRGTPARIPGEKFGANVDEVPVWWTSDGVLMLGLPDGQVRQLTRDRLAVPEYDLGAVSIREREGMSHVVSSLQKGGGENNMAATDTVVAEIRRNNITLDP